MSYRTLNFRALDILLTDACAIFASLPELPPGSLQLQSDLMNNAMFSPHVSQT
jgi:hypothetical protein